MKSKTLAIMFAATLSFVATPTFAQQRSPVRKSSPTRTKKAIPTSTKRSSGPARTSALVQVVGDRRTFDSKRAKLIDDSKATLDDLRSAKAAEGPLLTNKLSNIGSRLDVIESNAKALGQALRPNAKTGETKKARAHLATVKSRHARAATHLAAAKKASRAGDARAAQRAVTSLESEIRLIHTAAGKLAMLEPTMTR